MVWGLRVLTLALGIGVGRVGLVMMDGILWGDGGQYLQVI